MACSLEITPGEPHNSCVQHYLPDDTTTVASMWQEWGVIMDEEEDEALGLLFLAEDHSCGSYGGPDCEESCDASRQSDEELQSTEIGCLSSDAVHLAWRFSEPRPQSHDSVACESLSESCGQTGAREHGMYRILSALSSGKGRRQTAMRVAQRSACAVTVIVCAAPVLLMCAIELAFLLGPEPEVFH